MALTRKSLSAMGIEQEKIDQIIEMHTETVSALKDQINTLNDNLEKQKEEAGKLPAVQKELDDLKQTVAADAKEREGKDYDKLKKEFDDYKAEQELKETRAAKEKALRGLLGDMKMSDKGITQVIKWRGVDAVELDEEGKLKDAATLRKSIKEDWGDYIQTAGTQGATTPAPPANTGNPGGMSKAEIMKIKDAGERQKAIMENPELFGLPGE